MNLHKLELEGIGSYIEKTEIDFDKIRLALLKGGNGSGKSWLLDAIAWALYDETIRGYKKDEAINNVLNEGRVNLFLSDDKGRNVLIDRRRKRDKGDVTVTIDGVNKYGTLPEMQKVIVDLVGMNFTLFRNSCMFGQNDLMEFASTTDKGRKDIIGYLIGFEELDGWLEKVRKSKSLVEKQVDALTTAISLNMQQISKIVIEDTSELEKGIEEASGKLIQLDTRRKSLHENEILLTKKTELENRYKALERQIDTLKDEIQRNEQAITQKQTTFSLLSGINADLGNCEIEVGKYPALKLEEDKHRLDMQELAMKKSASETLLQSYKNELFELTSLSAGTCPKCKQAVTPDWIGRQKVSIEKSVADREKEVSNLLTEYKDISAKLQEVLGKGKVIDKVREHKEELLKKQGELLTKIAMVEKIEKDIEEQRVKLSTLLEDYSTLGNEIKGMVVEDVDKNELFTISKELIEKQALKDSLLSRKTIAQQQAKLKQELEASLSKNESEQKDNLRRLEIHKILEEGLGQNGIRNILIESLIPIMEQKANEYLNSLLEGVTISFDTKVEGKTVVKDEFTILIHDNRGREPVTRSFKGWSGGEKLLIALVLRLVLWNIGYMKSKTRMNFILMDEILGCLEQKNREKVIELLVKLNSELNVKILLIEHLEELEERFPQVISVTNNGGSRIEWVKE